MSVERFETTFVRDAGFAFRFFDESGHLQHAVLATGGRVESWSIGDTQAHLMSADSLTPALNDLKGVTELSSWLVPSLLFGRNPLAAGGAWYGGEELCWKCPAIVFVQPSQAVTEALFLDLGTGVVRRFFFTQAVPPSSAASHRISPALRSEVGIEVRESLKVEILISYESPEFDVDGHELLPELEKRSW
jgi:hypothetical protein